MSSPQPARKAHITDWYDKDIEKGLHLKSFQIEPLEFHATVLSRGDKTVKASGEIAVIHYRIHYLWVNKEGKGEPQTTRIHHTWLRVGDRWQIIAGMSAPTDANGK